MSALDAALAHAAKGRPVFPRSARGVPMIPDWGNAATVDPVQITSWWTEWPFAQIGMPTGQRTGLAVLDIDRKNGKDGFRTLAALGYVDLPQTPTVLTRTGGYHLHFQRPEGGFRNTVGAGGRGIGAGLDWRCDGGMVVLPSPGSGYRWGDWNCDNCTRLPVPADLLPREVEPNPYSGRLASIGPTTSGLSGVLRRLHTATEGERNALLFWSACRFVEGVAAGVISEEGARTLLHRGGAAIGLRQREIDKTIQSAFRGRA